MRARRIVIGIIAHLVAFPPARLAGYIVAAVAMGLLAGCGSAPPRYVNVPTPIAVECREEMPARPAMPTAGLDPRDSLTAKVQAMEAEIDLREAFELRLVAALTNCKRPIAPAAGVHDGQ